MRSFQLLILFSFINLSISFGQQFYELPLDRRVYTADSLFKNDKLIINYENILNKATFTVEYKNTNGCLPNGTSVYKDSSGNIVTGKYVNGQMVGIWTVKDSNGTLIRKINYNFESNKIPETELNYGKFVRDTVDPHLFASNNTPTFLGENNKIFNQFIKENTFIPPSFRFFYNETEKVFVEFIVYKNGKIINPKIIHGENRDLNYEALRIINMSPEWDKFNNDKLNAVKFTFPIIFKN